MKETPLAQRVFSFSGFGVILAIAIFACFPDVLLGHSSLYFRDYGVLGYPVVHFFRQAFEARELPLWNPLSNCGVPFFAQWGAMGAYPLSLVYLLLPLPWSLSLFCFLHLWIGGMGMYLLARRWTENPVAAGVAGAGYCFSGVMFASFIWPNYFVALGWMPYVVLLAERAWREGGRWIAGGAIVAALQLGSGAPEVILFTWLIVGVLWICDFAEVPGNAAKLAGRVVAVVLLAGGLMAVQMLPFFDLLIHSQRQSPFTAAKWSLPIWAAANFIAPLLNCFQTMQGQYFQYGQEFLSSVYLGLPMLVLALVGVAKYPAARTWALLLLAIFCVVLAFGDNTAVFPALRRAFPLVSVARYPVKFLFVPAFILPLLASLTVRALHTEPKVTTRPIVYTALFVALVGGAAVWATHEGMLADTSAWPKNFRMNAAMSWNDAAMNAALRGGILVAVLVLLFGAVRPAAGGAIAAVLVIALIAFDGRTHAPNQNPTLPAAEFRTTAWDDGTGPRPKPGEGRVFITPKSEEVLLNVSSTNATRLWRAKRQAEWSNLNLLDGVPKVNGSATLQAADEARFQSALYSATNIPAGVLDFLAVSYESAAEVGHWEKRDSAMPYITAGQAVLFASDDQSLAMMFSGKFDPRRQVIFPVEAQAVVTATNAAAISVTNVIFSRERVECDVDAPAAGPVVVAQSFYHCWTARLNGEPATLYRANSAFQAVMVPAGKHHIQLEYRDSMLRAGMIVSGLAAVLCLIVLCVPGKRTG